MKKRLTVTLAPDLIALARTAVHQTKGWTLNSLADAGLRLVIKRLERQRGRCFRPQPIRLRTGRPRQTMRKQEG